MLKFEGKMTILLEARNVTRKYTDPVEVQVLRGISISLGAGEFVALVGASGSGKSTLLNLLGALDRPTEGDILYRGRSIRPFSDKELAEFRQRKIGFVFQSHYLLPEFSSLENICLPAWVADPSGYSQTLKRGNELLEKVGLSHRSQHKPYQLSGGEAQRVAVARSLINSPDILLADEPTGNLDRQNREKLYDLLRQLNRDTGITMVIVTHDENISQHADRVLRLSDGCLEGAHGTE